MKTTILVIVIVCIPYLAFGADWKLYYEGGDPLPPLSAYGDARVLIDEIRFREGSRTPYYYDLASVVRMGGTVRTWTKMIMLPHKFDILQLWSKPWWKDIVGQGETYLKTFTSTFVTEEIHFYFEINCAERSYRRLGARELDRSGLVVDGLHKPKLELKFVEPDSDMEALYKVLCK